MGGTTHIAVNALKTAQPELDVDRQTQCHYPFRIIDIMELI